MLFVKYNFQGIHESRKKINNLNDFKFGMIGKSTKNNGLFGYGIYFTAQKRRKGDVGYGKIKNKFYVQLKKPFFVSVDSVFWIIKRLNIRDSGVLFALEQGYASIAFIKIMRMNNGNINNILMTNKLIIMGFDGVIYEENAEIIECCLFKRKLKRYNYSNEDIK